MIHAHVILIECALWILLLTDALRTSPWTSIFEPSFFLQVPVFVYGLLIYRTWLLERRSSWFRPLFFWLPQVLIFTLQAPNELARLLDPQAYVISAALPLQGSIELEFTDSSRITTSSVNMIALLGLIAAAVTDRRWRSSAPMIQSAQSTAAVRRILATALFVVPVVMMGAGLLLRSTKQPVSVPVEALQGVSAFTAEALPLPEGLQQVKLKSGTVIPMQSLRLIKWTTGATLLELTAELALDKEPDKQLEAEAIEVWERFRPLVMTRGVKAATLKVSGPAQGELRLRRVTGFTWRQDEKGTWQRSAPELVP